MSSTQRPSSFRSVPVGRTQEGTAKEQTSERASTPTPSGSAAQGTWQPASGAQSPMAGLLYRDPATSTRGESARDGGNGPMAGMLYAKATGGATAAKPSVDTTFVVPPQYQFREGMATN